MQCLNFYDGLAEEQEYESYIAGKMEKQRQESIQLLSTIVRQDVIEDFARILSAAYEYESPEAEKIAQRFGLNQSHFLAIDDKFEDYKKYYEENQTWSRDE